MTTAHSDDLPAALREAEAHDRKLRGDLVTARGRVGYLERCIAEHEKVMSVLKRKVAEMEGKG